MAGLVLVAENDRTTSSKLSVLDYRNVDSAAPVLAEARVVGHVRDEPALRGRDLFVPTSGERVFAYRVSDEPGRAVLSPVGSYQTETDHPAAIYLHTGPEGQLCANGRRLRRFELDTEGFRLLPQEAAIGAAAQPLQSWGNFLYVGRYPGWSQAVVISQVEREEMISRWRTVVGAAVIAWLDRSGGLLGITETGEIFVLGEQAIRQGGMQQTPFEILEISAGVRRALRATPISNDQLAVDLAGPKPRLDVLGSDGRVRATYPLDQELTASPVGLGRDLVVALPGRIRVLPAVKPTEPTSDLVLPVVEGETPPIVQLFPLDEQQVLAIDSTGRLRRIQRRDQPSPHLAVAGDTQLKQPPTFAGVKAGQTVVLADAAGLVPRRDVVSLSLIAELSRGSPPASGSWRL